jgi:hypothetical protein
VSNAAQTAVAPTATPVLPPLATGSNGAPPNYPQNGQSYPPVPPGYPPPPGYAPNYPTGYAAVPPPPPYWTPTPVPHYPPPPPLPIAPPPVVPPPSGVVSGPGVIPSGSFPLTAMPERDAVRLFWNPVPGATMYALYRAQNNGPVVLDPIYARIPSTSVRVNGLTPGMLYLFEVAALDPGGVQIARSLPLSTSLPPYR